MNARTTREASQEKLMNDMRSVVADAEELLRATAGQTGDKIATMRERVQKNLDAAKERIVEAEQELLVKAREAAKATDDYVHENPWRAVGVAAGVGLIIGMLISRGR